MRRGFTLIELSIVLVIIGLLIGGILVAQSMIQTTKIQHLIRDLAQYEVAVNNFKTNYKYYPGDAPGFTPPGNGDGNSGTGAGGTICVAPHYWNIEAISAFPHLSQAQMLFTPQNTQYVPYTPTDCGGTMNTYILDDSLKGIVMPYTEVSATAADVLYDNTHTPGIELSQDNPGANYYFRFYVNASYTIPLESKLGKGAVADSTIGLANAFTTGKCGSTSFTIVSCNASNAAYSLLYYYLGPI